MSTIGSSPYFGSSPIAVGIYGARAYGYGLPYLIAVWNVGMRGACDEHMNEEPDIQGPPPFIDSRSLEAIVPVTTAVPAEPNGDAMNRAATRLSKTAIEDEEQVVRHLVYGFVRIKPKGAPAMKQQLDIPLLLLHWE